MDDARVPCSLDYDQEPICGHAANVAQVHVDRREWRSYMGRHDLPGIEADDGHIIGEVSLMV